MSDYVLQHHGIKGQKWGVRRFQNPDGTRTEAGKKRYKTEAGGNIVESNRHSISSATIRSGKQRVNQFLKSDAGRKLSKIAIDTVVAYGAYKIAKKIVPKILEELYASDAKYGGYKSFDDWWDNFDIEYEKK